MPSDDRGDGGDHIGRADDSERDDGGLSLKLPPIRLPSLFPENFHILWPAPGEGPRRHVSKRAVLVAVLLFDVVDAVLALAVDSGAVVGVRVVGGALVAATTFGTLGVAYVWEAVAALAGFGELTVAPTLTALFVVRSLR
ncbi:hypothetical protein LPA44_02230 [Halobacterium sp. KA-4]|jgi:hypothetical protein|uniref:hypothetical protein n=1 Tax=Halobacterium sp. KA-4 TaxID=2896367 RepID=UPI001E5AB847|nr:hypothetical protein [Halobacterium sp. KA-4]MCD2198718.1 hypothetical protein [Halobacterium sp. KA-4]